MRLYISLRKYPPRNSAREASQSTCNITVMEAVVENPITHFSLACLQCRRSKGAVIAPTPSAGSVLSKSTPSHQCACRRINDEVSPRRRVTCDYPNRRKERVVSWHGSNSGVSRPLHSSACQQRLRQHTDRRKKTFRTLACSHQAYQTSPLYAFWIRMAFHQMRLETPKVDVAVPRAVADLTGSTRHSKHG